MSPKLPQQHEPCHYRGLVLESEISADGFARVLLHCPVEGHLTTFIGHSLLELRQTARAYVDKLVGKYGGEE